MWSFVNTQTVHTHTHSTHTHTHVSHDRGVYSTRRSASRLWSPRGHPDDADRGSVEENGMPWSCSRRCDCGEVGILPVPLSTRLQIAPRLAALRLHHTSSVLLHKFCFCITQVPFLHYTISVFALLKLRFCITEVPFGLHKFRLHSFCITQVPFALHKFRLHYTSSVCITQVPFVVHKFRWHFKSTVCITQAPFLHYTSSVWKSSVLHKTSSACITQVPFALYKFLLHFA